MTAITFDTLAYANQLKKAGVQSAQAEAQAEALYGAMVNMSETNFATKNDLKDLETKLTLRMGTMLAISVGILSSLIVILHPH